MLEHNVISTALQKPEMFAGLNLHKEYFVDSTLGEVWSQIQQMLAQSELINFALVADALNKGTGKNYTKYLGEICKNSLPASNQSTLDKYAEKMAESHRERAAVAACDVLRDSITNGGQNSIDACIRDLMSLSAENKKYTHDAKDKIRLALDSIQSAWDSKGLVGVSTGLKTLDDQLGGLHDSDLIIIGARPAMGKTALAINMMLNSDARCGFISGEQSAAQIGMRLMSMTSGVPLHDLRLAKYSDDDNAAITSGAMKVTQHQIYTNDRPGINNLEIQRQAREWKQKHDIQILFIDYLQKINSSMQHGTKAEAVGEVAVSFKNLAKELNIPVVALAQVNRSVEQRPDKRPMCSDIKDCGIIEQEADVIAMLYRDEVYNDDSQFKGIAEINIEKNRSGPIGDMKVGFEKKLLKFYDLGNVEYDY